MRRGLSRVRRRRQLITSAGAGDRYPWYATEEFIVNVSAIDPTSAARDHLAAAATTQKSPATAAPAAPPAQATSAAHSTPAVRSARPTPAARAVSVAALSTPAATVSTTSIPATVKPEDRAEYLQLLKALGGNVSAALAALAAKAAATQTA
jgi:hypothetical protein